MTSWSLSGSALDRLLLTLDPDRDRAAAAYEQLRERISGLFRWWGSDRADELADETLDRVARKLEEGTVIAKGSFGAFVRGVARLIFYEASRRRPDVDPIERHPDLRAAPPNHEVEAAASCLTRCLDTIGSDRGWILRYYDASEGKIETRKQLARELGVAAPALRVRAHRVRERLEQCVKACVQAS